MANIFYAWEFGANLGHIGAFLPLARALRERGHDVHWGVTNTGSAARLLDGEFVWLQAPACPERLHAGPPLNYGDMIGRFGFADADDLLGLTVAWRELLHLTDAQLVLADHAPGAILAARTLDLPVMLFGHGFFTPPPGHPSPNFRPWTPIATTSLTALDGSVITAINRVLARFEKPPLTSIADLFTVAEPALMTFPELDHYAGRGDAAYWGTLPTATAAPPVWPDLPGKRIFVYLRPDGPHCLAALEHLRASDVSVLAYVPGLSTAQSSQLASKRLRFLAAPVDLSRAAREADAAITYASLSTTAAFLLAGKPVLTIPGNLEQHLLALRIEEMGAGLLFRAETPASELASAIGRILFDPCFTGNAHVFARKYAAFSQDSVVANLVRRIEELSS